MSVNQFTFNGVTMGAGTAYAVQSVTGLRGLPDVVANDTPRLTVAGSYAGYDTAGERIIDMTVMIRGGVSVLETAMAALESAMAPLATSTSTFTFQFNGQSGSHTCQVRPRRMQVVGDATYTRGFCKVALQWVALDPTIT